MDFSVSRCHFQGFKHQRCETSQPWAKPTQCVEGCKGPQEYRSRPDAGPSARHPGANGIANDFLFEAYGKMVRWPRLERYEPLALDNDFFASQKKKERQNGLDSRNASNVPSWDPRAPARVVLQRVDSLVPCHQSQEVSPSWSSGIPGLKIQSALPSSKKTSTAVLAGRFQIAPRSRGGILPPSEFLIAAIDGESPFVSQCTHLMRKKRRDSA